jgi:hypothetical protein
MQPPRPSSPTYHHHHHRCSPWLRIHAPSPPPGVTTDPTPTLASHSRTHPHRCSTLSPPAMWMWQVGRGRAGASDLSSRFGASGEVSVGAAEGDCGEEPATGVVLHGRPAAPGLCLPPDCSQVRICGACSCSVSRAGVFHGLQSVTPCVPGPPSKPLRSHSHGAVALGAVHAVVGGSGSALLTSPCPLPERARQGLTHCVNRASQWRTWWIASYTRTLTGVTRLAVRVCAWVDVLFRGVATSSSVCMRCDWVCVPGGRAGRRPP